MMGIMWHPEREKKIKQFDINIFKSFFSVVNGLILVAGKGTRMRELTKFPKCLTSINGKPLIELIIQNFKKSGINNHNPSNWI